jgi:hypothetical protein
MHFVEVPMTVAELRARDGLDKAGVVTGKAHCIKAQVVVSRQPREVYLAEKTCVCPSMDAVACAAITVTHGAMDHRRGGQRFGHRRNSAPIVRLNRLGMAG